MPLIGKVTVLPLRHRPTVPVGALHMGLAAGELLLRPLAQVWWSS